MSAQELTPHQQHALVTVLGQLDESRVAALTGYAGAGKTTLIPHIVDALPGAVVCAMTHKAAAILRAKGIEDAATFHSAVYSRPSASKAYAEFEAWCIDRGAPYPALLRHIDQTRACAIRDEHHASIGHEGVARLLGIDPDKQVRFSATREYVGGTLIVDEASMATRKQIDDALDVFDNIVLVGDPGQLPPVNEKTDGGQAFDFVNPVMLTEVHRQTEESPVLRLAHAVRRGVPLWRAGIKIEATGPLPGAGQIIVWRNKTRISMSLMTRSRLGIEGAKLQVGEPVASKSRNPFHAIRGFRNNALLEYSGEGMFLDSNGDEVRAPAMGGDKGFPAICVEELDRRDPVENEVPLRLAYAITAHTAQGSEWDRVQISYDDARALERFDRELYTRWLYTAITRAKESVRFFSTPALFARA